MAKSKNTKVAVENINHPGKVNYVDARLYAAMKRAYLAVLPGSAPGMTLVDIGRRLRPLLPQELYPNGDKAGWYAKTVQLDLEAKGLIQRTKSQPLRLYRSGRGRTPTKASGRLRNDRKPPVPPMLRPGKNRHSPDLARNYRNVSAPTSRKLSCKNDALETGES